MTLDAKVTAEREVRTFVDLSHGSDVLLAMAQKQKEGSYYTLMGSLLLRAFTFEAYANHLGCEKTKLWPEVETLRVMDKYSLLCKTFGVEPDFSRRPYQTLGSLFRFRNAIAHGKSVVLKVSKKAHKNDNPHDHVPVAEWEEYVTEDSATRADTDISAIIAELHKAAGLGDHPFIHGVGHVSMTWPAPNEN